MSKAITDFASSFVAENMNPEPYDPGNAIISAHMKKLEADAAAHGISVEQLEAHVGNLSDFISEALDASTDDEVERLASRDD